MGFNPIRLIINGRVCRVQIFQLWHRDKQVGWYPVRACAFPSNDLWEKFPVLCSTVPVTLFWTITFGLFGLEKTLNPTSSLVGAGFGNVGGKWKPMVKKKKAWDDVIKYTLCHLIPGGSTSPSWALGFCSERAISIPHRCAVQGLATSWT